MKTRRRIRKKTQRGGIFNWLRKKFSRKHPTLPKGCKWWSMFKQTHKCRLQRNIAKLLDTSDDAVFKKFENVGSYSQLCELLKTINISDQQFDKLKKLKGFKCDADLVRQLHAQRAAEIKERRQSNEFVDANDFNESNEFVDADDFNEVETQKYNDYIRQHSFPKQLVQRTEMQINLIQKILEVAYIYSDWIDDRVDLFLAAKNTSDLLTVLIKIEYLRNQIPKYIPELLEINEIGNYIKHQNIAEYVSAALLKKSLLKLIFNYLTIISAAEAKEGRPSLKDQMIISFADNVLDRLRSG